ncbi:MAG: RecQ family ATP-dependent DNA helicase, partial [Balneolales bacterium]|nr:RecQ family ATP-dependent DNA helicase [Balneolales bacterium]
NSTIPNYKIEQRLVNARNGMYKLLYCAPERLKTPLFQAEMEQLNIELIAVDEAHCISEWGHEFRPAYREIRSAFDALSHPVKWLALTATATPEVRQDILDSLRFEDPVIISRGFSRPNLKWWVVNSQNKKGKVRSSIQKAAKQGDGLMYGGTRRNCEDWANELSQTGIPAEAYHAGMDSEKRKNIQTRWISGETPLVIATNAFGMGIDKPDCRYVFHEEMPYSIEAYYQEAGRAGRDGEEAFPILFYRDSDYNKLRKRIQDNYPTRKELGRVYNALCDSLNLAVGSVMPELRPYQMDKIKTRSAIPIPIIKASLKLMEQFDVLIIRNEVPAMLNLQFALSQEMMIRFRERCGNPEKVEFVDKLERMFGHLAFGNSVQIELELVLQKLQVTRNVLIKALNVLMQHDQVLMYSIQDENNLIRLLHPRMRELPLGRDEIENYRNNLLTKLDYMNGYAETKECREVYLRNYFGDTDAKKCGKCDNCSAGIQEELVLTSKEIRFAFEALVERKISINALEGEQGWSKTKVREVLKYLTEEQMIEPDESNQGYYRLVVS